ncbi:AraC family transcriptional regulator [Paenibacillus whitsoniae]|uniref:AraC family transcriptional regulator n=1 Tax=Paenibacillus whitsoniae TaxID=2496558 RepID=A0A430JH54_9BACL|nr:AraC family transcriptional regulator [Paenibacillus whitsoniae]RTE10332.1 AraC family transcriptional regulator [Paenibacillus whitsoniae]
MDTIHESLRMEQSLHLLTDLIRRHAPSNGTHQTSVPSLALLHATTLSEPLESVYKPSICVVVQGAKIATLGDETYRYDPSTYLVTSVELPIKGQIVEGSSETPFLSLKLHFDPDVVLDIVQAKQRPEVLLEEDCRGITVSRTSPALLEALVRLLQLLDAPEDIHVLSPLIIREILYRVLQSETGVLLHQSAIIGSHAHRIAQAIQFINRNYDKPLKIEQLATTVNMSTSSFHKHFKRITAMSPLQYQKTVRLQEARHLMLMETLPVSDASFRVGYESPSQFSREYTRMYGQSPLLDVKQLRSSITGTNHT